MTKKRTLYFDLLRILAITGVVVLHVAAKNWGSISPNTYEWQILNLFDGGTRWCVAIFIMISGALYLNPKKKITTESILKKSVLRLVIVMFIWSFIYAISNVFLIPEYSYNSLFDFIKTVVHAPLHFWFMPMIISLYLLTPLLKKITEDIKLTEYFLILGIVFTFLIPSVTPFVPKLNELIYKPLEYFELGMVAGFPTFYVLGYYLSTKEFSDKINKMLILLGKIGILFTVLMTSYLSLKHGHQYGRWYHYITLNNLMAATGIFIYFKTRFKDVTLSEKWTNKINQLSNNSFGIYITHFFVYNGITLAGIVNLSFNPALSIPILTIVIMYVSYIFVDLLIKIPKINKYLF